MGFKTLVLGLTLCVMFQAVSGLFWNYLGAGGLFALCSLKGNCKGPHKRDTDTLHNVSRYLFLLILESEYDNPT